MKIRFICSLLTIMALFIWGCATQTDDPSDSQKAKSVFYPVVAKLATVAFDLTRDVTGSTTQNNVIVRALQSPSSETITHEGFSGSAEFTGIISPEIIDGSITLNDFISRQGFPTFDSGNLDAELTITETTIVGRIFGNDLVIDGAAASLDINYDLYLYNGLWRGVMEGQLTIDGESFSFNYDYDTPSLTNLSITPVDSKGEPYTGIIHDGGTAKLRVEVNSNAPVNWMDYSWDSPKSNLCGGGSGAKFTEVSRGFWVYEQDYSISAYQPSGIYTWRVSVTNAALLKSNEKIVSVDVNNSKENVEKPAIISAAIESTGLTSGTGSSVTLTVTARSEAPVNWISLSLTGPTDSIEGGGMGVSFENVGENTWKYSRTWDFTKWAVNGEYTISNLSVESEANLASDVYDVLHFTISNNPIANTPTISDINFKYYQAGEDPVTQGQDINGSSLSAASASDPLHLALIVTATSNAPMSWINYSFDGPSSNIFGGGSGINADYLGNDTWRYVFTCQIDSPAFAPKGIYSWSNINVGNAGQKFSEKLPGSLSFELKE